MTVGAGSIIMLFLSLHIIYNIEKSPVLKDTRTRKKEDKTSQFP